MRNFFGSAVSNLGTLSDVGAYASYNKTMGFWIDKNGHVQNMSFNGNKYTGGRLKYAKALSTKFKAVSGYFSLLNLYDSTKSILSGDSHSMVMGAANIMVIGLEFIPVAGPIISAAWTFGGEYWFDTHLAYDLTHVAYED